MKLFYITNARIPSEKAHSVQIMKSCEAFARHRTGGQAAGMDVALILPRRVHTRNEDPFEYYGVKKIFTITKLRNLDLFDFSWMPRKLAFYLQSLSFGFRGAWHAAWRREPHAVFYSRDFATLFFLCLFGLHPVAEIHDYRSIRPRWHIRYIFRNARRIVVNSEGTKSLLAVHYPLCTSAFVAPNAVDTDFFNIPEMREEARAKLGLPQDKIIIGYVGRFSVAGMDKGVGMLREAFELMKRCAEAYLLVVGGPEFSIPYTLVPLYLRAIDIAVIPYPGDQHAKTTSPIKLYEYMATHKTIVVANNPDPHELAKKLDIAIANPQPSTKPPPTWDQRAQRIIEFITCPVICYYGNFDPAYARNRVIMRGLEQNGVRIVHSLHVSHDFVIVGYSDSRWTVPMAWLLNLFSPKPLIWDAFYSLYDSWVFDRKLVSPRSPKACWYWFLDWLSCRLADRILLDTDVHIDYFVKTFRIPKHKFIRVFIGADDQIFHP